MDPCGVWPTKLVLHKLNVMKESFKYSVSIKIITKFKDEISKPLFLLERNVKMFIVARKTIVWRLFFFEPIFEPKILRMPFRIKTLGPTKQVLSVRFSSSFMTFKMSYLMILRSLLTSITWL